MSDKKISQLVLEKLKEKNIKPKARWGFLLKNYSIWALGVICLVVGSLSFAVVFYMFRYNDWEIYQNVNDSLLEFLLITMPYFWILLIGLFIAIVNYNIKHTKHGYKYNIKIILLVTIVSSVVLGGILFKAGVGRAIDNIMLEKAPFYKHVINHRMGMWSNPEKGMLMGEIVGVLDNGFSLIESNGKIWVVDTNNARIISIVKIEEGEIIKLVGKRIGETEFKAIIVAPIGPGRGCFNNDNFGGCRPPKHTMPPPPVEMMEIIID
jgi:hypothetical protein